MSQLSLMHPAETPENGHKHKYEMHAHAVDALNFCRLEGIRPAVSNLFMVMLSVVYALSQINCTDKDFIKDVSQPAAHLSSCAECISAELLQGHDTC